MKFLMQLCIIIGIAGTVITVIVLGTFRFRSEISMQSHDLSEPSSKTADADVVQEKTHIVPKAITLVESDFMPFRDATVHYSTTVKYRSVETGNITPFDSLAPHLQNRLARLTRFAMPLDGTFSLEYLLSFLWFAQFPSEPTSKYPINEGESISLEDMDRQKKTEASIKEFDVSVERIVCEDLRLVNVLDIFHRLISEIGIQIGIPEDGYFIIGYNEKWASTNEPLYLLEFAE